jgi:hypothetical protein
VGFSRLSFMIIAGTGSLDDGTQPGLALQVRVVAFFTGGEDGIVPLTTNLACAAGSVMNASGLQSLAAVRLGKL